MVCYVVVHRTNTSAKLKDDIRSTLASKTTISQFSLRGIVGITLSFCCNNKSKEKKTDKEREKERKRDRWTD